MGIDFIIHNVWVAVVVWGIVYIGDYTLTIIGARKYLALAGKFVTLGGSYELNPVFEKDVNALRLISPRFVALFMVTCALMWLLGARAQTTKEYDVFAFVLGAFLLMETTIYLRHLQNIWLFDTLTKTNDVSGQLTYNRRYTFRASAQGLFHFGVFYLILFALFTHTFFLGGAVGCALLALRHWIQARRMKISATP